MLNIDATQGLVSRDEFLHAYAIDVIADVIHVYCFRNSAFP